MAIGPRLDLRQSQTLVMTPQLRQAIKLLQFSNVEVAAFVEEELERNPLLERDERGDGMPRPSAPRLDQVVPVNGHATDAAEMARSDDPADRGRLAAGYGRCRDLRRRRRGGRCAEQLRAGPHGGSADFSDDDRDIGDLAETRRSLRDHLGEQLRLSFADPVDRMIGAHLIALLCPAGRLTARPEDIADAMALPLERVEAVRAVMMRFDPVGLFARDLRECLAAQLAERNRLDPAMATLLDNLELLARRETRRLMALCGVDSEDLADMIGEIRALDPKPAANCDSTPRRRSR